MKRPLSGIATDGAHSTRERSTSFRAVDLSSGKELFREEIGNWTNNIGEFLGIVAAVKYILEHSDIPRIIYSDSITAITWYLNRRTASTRHLKAMEERIKDMRIEHWNNKLWGENPADFGNK